jgi:RHS repeat-associated protein
MPGRKYSAAGSAYRYGFNGKELDNSTGEGNLDFGARIMDVRLGRWLSTDPVSEKYPNLSPYIFVANSPIMLLDANGKDFFIYYDKEEDKRTWSTFKSLVESRFS